MSAEEDQFEEVEGLTDEPELEGEYPIDDFLIRTDHRTVFAIVRHMKRPDSPYVQPEFQRDFVWDAKKQSRLIESAILRIPLPVFYLAEREDGKIVIVDGLQRLTTFKRYLNNDFPLVGVNNSSLHGKRFSDLPARLQDRVENTNLILYILDVKVPERARLEIFERVNSGDPLSRQQMRNALYNGQATIWLRIQAHSNTFKEATTESLNRKTMRDREFVNRFCGFYLIGYEKYIENYGGDMDLFLADTLSKMNQLHSDDLDQLKDVFQKSMRHNEAIFGRYAFRRHTMQDKEGGERRSVMNAALFDVWSVLLTKFPDTLTRQQHDHIREVFDTLMADTTFVDAIRISTNSGTKVRARFEKAASLLQG